MVFSLRPGSPVHCVYDFAPLQNPGQNPGQKNLVKNLAKTLVKNLVVCLALQKAFNSCLNGVQWMFKDLFPSFVRQIDRKPKRIISKTSKTRP